MPYKRILLAYDGSKEGRVALREGASLAKKCGAQVFLLSVVPNLFVSDGSVATSVQPEDHEAIFREGLAKAAEIGLTVNGEMVTGDPAEEIPAYAARINADLVVVGHRRRSIFERWWSGPRQSWLSDKLPCSLLVAKNEVSKEEMDALLNS